MAQKAMVFKTGTHNRKPFDSDRVKKIFGNINGSIKAIFAHTSKWVEANKDPLEIGEFSNFEINDKGEVYADLEFNEKGLNYKQDNAIKGISVELDPNNDVLTKIALLPIGVKAAVQGAEFEEEMDLIEFELIDNNLTGGSKMGIEAILAALSGLTLDEKLSIVTSIGKSIDETQKRAFRAINWEFEEKTQESVKEFAEFAGIEIEFKEKAKPKTEEEIRKEIAQEFEEKEKTLERKHEREKFMSDNKDKIYPSIAPIMEFAYEKAQLEENQVIEFSAEEKISMKQKMINTMGTMKAVVKKETSKEYVEFSEEDPLMIQAKEMGKNINIID